MTRTLAVLTVLFAAVLLTLGGLTTSFRAGMADPVWPTEPWFLVVNGHKYELERHRGFLLEHTHRLAGFAVGALASLLALSAWLGGPNKLSRAVGLFAVVALLATYGDLHRRMMQAWELRKAGLPFTWPHAAIYSTLTAAGLLVGASLAHLRSGQPGKWVRFLTSLILIAVMFQGLLGGLRVFLDAQLGISRTLGVELAAIHGVFAQVVFAAMVCVPILCRPEVLFARRASEGSRELATSGELFESQGVSEPSLARRANILVATVFLQLIWAAWVRHAPTSLGQRLHFLTAFVVVGLAVALAGKMNADPRTWRAHGKYTRHLIGLLALQVLLGVEAWMGKFGLPGGYDPGRAVTPAAALTRTLHQLVGTGILAGAVALALRLGRAPSAGGHSPPAAVEQPNTPAGTA